MVTDAREWAEDAPDVILIGNDKGGIDELKRQHKEGKLHIIAETAPFYSGKLADDPS